MCKYGAKIYDDSTYATYFEDKSNSYIQLPIKDEMKGEKWKQ